MQECFDVPRGFWEVIRKWGCITIKVEFQKQRFADWDREVIDEDEMWLLRIDVEFLQVG